MFWFLLNMHMKYMYILSRIGCCYTYYILHMVENGFCEGEKDKAEVHVDKLSECPN
jgi:hypothetical protein